MSRRGWEWERKRHREGGFSGPGQDGRGLLVSAHPSIRPQQRHKRMEGDTS